MTRQLRHPIIALALVLLVGPACEVEPEQSELPRTERHAEAAEALADRLTCEQEFDAEQDPEELAACVSEAEDAAIEQMLPGEGDEGFRASVTVRCMDGPPGVIPIFNDTQIQCNGAICETAFNRCVCVTFGNIDYQECSTRDWSRPML